MFNKMDKRTLHYNRELEFSSVYFSIIYIRKLLYFLNIGLFIQLSQIQCNDLKNLN